MKNVVTSVAVILLALLIFYGGAGVNYITYCCNDCRSEGIEVVVDKKCCEIHGHHHLGHEKALAASDHEHDATCIEHHPCTSSGQQEDEDCCGLERIDFEWETAVVQIPVFQPVATDLFCFSRYNIPRLTEPEENFITTFEEVSPPLVCPRAYLSLLTTLLI